MMNNNMMENNMNTMNNNMNMMSNNIGMINNNMNVMNNNMFISNDESNMDTEIINIMLKNPMSINKMNNNGMMNMQIISNIEKMICKIKI